jgi:thiosulfate dehydrogenase [quinone] large subunit
VVDLRVFVEGVEVVSRYVVASRATLEASRIDNRWLVRVRSGPHGLVLPLGGRATLSLPAQDGAALAPGRYRIELEDVSGAVWSRTILLEPSA